MSSKSPPNDADDIATLKRALAERTKELQEARDALERSEKRVMLGQLVSTVAHELRSPLGAMLTSLHMVESRVEKGDVAARRGLERIRRSVRRCDQIITNMLDFSRHEQLALEQTHIDQWLQALFHSQSLPEGVSLTFDPGFGSASASIDRDKLQRAVAHIIDNAAQATLFAGKPGKVAVSSRLIDGNLEIRIADNGPGIAEEHQGKIFEPFFSGRKAGIGLGLPIARALVEQHRGRVTFQSLPGEETIFLILLPVGG